MKFNKNIILLFSFALAVRVLFVLLFPLEAPDTVLYDAIAQNLLHYGNYSFDNITPNVAKPPLYPLFLAIIYNLFGHSFLIVRLIQSVMDSFTCIFIYLIAIKIFNDKRLGLIALGISSVYPELVASCSYVLTETLTTFLITLSVYFLMYTIASGWWVTVVTSGIFLGMATLCRPITLLFPAALLITAFLFRMTRNIFISFIWVGIVMILTISPWTIRNYIVFKKIIPVGIGGGSNLWLGSYLPWDGDYNYKDLSDKSKIEQGLSPIEADERLKQEAIKNIKKAPLVYMHLCIKKFGRFWLEIPGTKEVLRNKPLARRSIYAIYFFVLFFFFLGLVSLVKYWNSLMIPSLLMIVYFTLIHVLLFTIPRYRIPIMPLVIIISALGVCRTIEYIKPISEQRLKKKK